MIMKKYQFSGIFQKLLHKILTFLKTQTTITNNTQKEVFHNLFFKENLFWTHLKFRIHYSIVCKGVKPPPPDVRKNGILRRTLNCIWWWDSISGFLESIEYPLIAITPRSTLTRSSSTC